MPKFRNTSLIQPGELVTDEQAAQEIKILGFSRAASRLNRRMFLQTTAVAVTAAGGAALAGCSSSNVPGTSIPSSPTTPTTPASAPSVGDVLNFALNLEYLEAAFYATITTGIGTLLEKIGNPNPTITGASGPISFADNNVAELAAQLAADELAHVAFLRSTMQSLNIAPVAIPNLNLGALGPVTNDATFLAIARALETVGTSAYEGAAAYLVSNTQALDYAIQIHDTEAQHEGALRQFCVAKGVTSPAVDSSDIPPTPTAIFNTNAQGLNTSRTTSQVLGIVYANTAAGTAMGGFYPQGMNGNIKTV